MSQLYLPLDDMLVQPTSTTAKSVLTATNDKAAARKCRAAADALEKHITAKHDSANRMLALPPTRKRLQEGDSQRKEAARLQRIQITLRKLAEMHEKGTIVSELADLTSRAAVERALFAESQNSALRSIYENTDCLETSETMARRMEREAMLMGIPGFFPTPPDVAEQFMQFARLGEVRNLLEPSAGSGCLIDIMRSRHPGAIISYCEINCFLIEILRAKYEKSGELHFIGRDFFDLDPVIFQPRFDAIALNPPFERGDDAAHVLHAYKFLAPGGILAAIVSDGVFVRKDKKATVFRDFLRDSKADIAGLPVDAFKPSGTGVRCRMVRIRVGFGAQDGIS